MNDTPRVDTLSLRLHKRQFAWQILAPFLVVTALVIVAVVLVTTGAASATRTWADVSIIWIIAPLLIFALLFAVILLFFIYGIAKLTQATPRYTGKAQNFFAMLSTWTRKIADGATKPIVWVQQIGATIKSIFRR
ncbi:MAG: hypothetical protein ABIF04_07500 [Chloroflexota bacterium]